VRHPIYSNSGEVKCGYRLKKGINIARCCVNGYSITVAAAKCVTHVSFCGSVYVTTFQAQSDGGIYATRPVTWATGSVYFSVRGNEVQSEPSEPSGTCGYFRRKLGLLLMEVLDEGSSLLSKDGLPPADYLGNTHFQEICHFFHVFPYNSPTETPEGLHCWLSSIAS